VVIRTVTLNTGFDEILWVGDVDEGGVAPILERSITPSGKGINGARTIRAFGLPVVAYGLIGEGEEHVFRSMLRDEDIDTRLVTVRQRTRTNTTICPASGASTHYRAAGFTLDRGDAVEQLMATLLHDVRPGDLVSLHGSTPRGVAATAWRTMAEGVTQREAILVADIYGPPLVALLESRAPLVCKPNEEEAQVLRAVAATGPHAVAGVRTMREFGVWLPLVTCGAKGAVFGDDEGAWHVSLHPDLVVMEVGAGDACMGALIAAFATGQRDPHALVRAAMASAAAHVEGVTFEQLAMRAGQLADRAIFSRIV
jgi:1-phosphofructokinase family hexose kinase